MIHVFGAYEAFVGQSEFDAVAAARASEKAEIPMEGCSERTVKIVPSAELPFSLGSVVGFIPPEKAVDGVINVDRNRLAEFCDYGEFLRRDDDEVTLFCKERGEEVAVPLRLVVVVFAPGDESPAEECFG